MVYKASMDGLCKGVTVMVMVLFVVVTFVVTTAFYKTYGNSLTAVLLDAGIIALYIAIIFISYLYAPKSYSLTETQLIINRPAKDKIIPIADINEVQMIQSKDLRGTIRTMGNGGLFGYYGKYYNTRLGRMTWFMTQRKNMIMLRTKSKKILISPDDPGLLDVLQMKIGRSS